MPKRCVAAGCSTTSGEGFSVHEFPRNEALRAKWAQAVKRYRSNWDGPTAYSVLCSKHFEQDCFIVEGIRYREDMGIPAKKRLKPNAIPTKFTRPTHGESSRPTPPRKRTAYEKRQQQKVSVNTLVTILKYIYFR